MSKPEQKELNSQLWAIANDLRGRMESNEFKNYMLGFMFYRFICEVFYEEATKALKGEGISLEAADKDPEVRKVLEEEMIDKLGYYISYPNLFQNIIDGIVNDSSDKPIDLISQGFLNISESIKDGSGKDDFDNLFSDVDLLNPKLGNSVAERNQLVSKILLKINDILRDSSRDMLGDAFEYCLQQFASDAGKKGGEFFTPSQVSVLISKLIHSQLQNVTPLSIYDPTCGSGTLLIKAYSELADEKRTKIYGQELSHTSYNTARMNLLMHKINYRSFSIKQGDTLHQDQFSDDKFDVIVANPPFGSKWEHDGLEDDPRFLPYGKLAPKSKGEFAFVQHMFYHLEKHGIMATVAPLGVLFRGASEEQIRIKLIEDYDALDAVIVLPSNLFFGTRIPACILIFKKERKAKDVFFIDASNCFEKAKNQNKLRQEDIERIVDTYQQRQDIDKFARNVSRSEIKDNDYNLNIPRYIDTFEEEEPIDIEEVNKQLKELKAKIKEKEAKLEQLIKELDEI